MARRRYQAGTIIKVGDKIEKFRLRYVEYQIDTNGHEVRIRKSANLGLVSEIGTERAARRAAQPLLAEINANAGRPKHLITFAAVCKKWTEMVLGSHKQSSQNAAKSQMFWLEKAFGAVPIADINREMIQRWISQQTFSPKYVRNMISTFRVIWEAGQDWQYIPEDRRSPFDRIKLPKRGLVNKPTLTPEQIREVIRKADEPYRSIYWIVAETGMRGGEVCGLFIEDVDLENCLVHVRRSAFEGKLQTPKTGNAVRSFPVSFNLMNHIRLYVHNRERKGLLFRTVSGRPYRNGEIVARNLKPILRAMGADTDGLGLHGFRRASASAMDSLQTPMKVRQERLGHGSLAITMNYTSSNSSDHQIVAAELGKMFDPTSSADSSGAKAPAECRVEGSSNPTPVSAIGGASKGCGVHPLSADSPVQKPDNPEPEWVLAQGAD